MSIHVSTSRTQEGGIDGLVYLHEHTSASRLFLITEYKQSRCQTKEVLKILIKKTPLVIVLNL